MELRLTKVEQSLNKVELRLTKVEQRLNKVELGLTKVEPRLTKVEPSQLSCGSSITRGSQWTHIVP